MEREYRSWRLWVEGEPQPRQSVRDVIVRGKLGLPRIRRYQPRTGPAANWLKRVQVRAKVARPQPIFDGPLGLLLVIYRTKPAVWPLYRTWPSTRPDQVNYRKPLEDTLEGIVFKNDSRICVSYEMKRFSPNPGALIVVLEMPEIKNDLEAMLYAMTRFRDEFKEVSDDNE